MKILKKKDFTIEVAEGTGELTAAREKDLRMLYFSLIQYDKTPIELITEVIQDINKGLHNNVAQKLTNYLEFCTINEQVDVYNSIFCLITFVKDETKGTLTNLEVIEKTKMFEEKGFTFKDIKKQVMLFMKAYPAIEKAIKILAKK